MHRQQDEERKKLWKKENEEEQERTSCRLWRWQSSGRTKVYLALCLHTQSKRQEVALRKGMKRGERRGCRVLGVAWQSLHKIQRRIMRRKRCGPLRALNEAKKTMRPGAAASRCTKLRTLHVKRFLFININAPNGG